MALHLLVTIMLRDEPNSINGIQDAAAYVQNGIGMMASTAERINNLASFLVPFMSWLTVVALTAAALVLYIIPIRYVHSAHARGQVHATQHISPHVCYFFQVLDHVVGMPKVFKKAH